MGEIAEGCERVDDALHARPQFRSGPGFCCRSSSAGRRIVHLEAYRNDLLIRPNAVRTLAKVLCERCGNAQKDLCRAAVVLGLKFPDPCYP